MNDQETVATLVDLANYYANGGLSADNSDLVNNVIEIGRALDRNGGIQEMRRVFNMVPSMRGERTVEMQWDGIGEWRG
jgi:hypothetical protein